MNRETIWSTEWHSADKLAYVDLRVYAAMPPYPPMIRLEADEDIYITADDARTLAARIDDAVLIAETELETTKADSPQLSAPVYPPQRRKEVSPE